MTQPVDDPFHTRRRIALRLAASQIVFLLALVPVWAFLGLAKLDGGPAWRQTVLDLAVAGYPVALLLGAVLSWRSWRGGDYPMALKWTSLPLVWLLPIAVTVYLRSV